MSIAIITQEQIDSRHYWIDKISRLSGYFGINSEKVEADISQEIKNKGSGVLLGHLIRTTESVIDNGLLDLG